MLAVAERPSDTYQPGRKRCPGCCAFGESLPLAAFGPDRSRRDGLQSRCRGCRAETDRRRYERRREAHIERNARQRERRRTESRERLWRFFLEHPCAHCGERDPVVLELHHGRGTKGADIGTLLTEGYQWSAIERELEKCEVLCANCHRRVTAREQRHWRWGRA